MPAVLRKASPMASGAELANLARQAESVRELILGEENLKTLEEIRQKLLDNDLTAEQVEKGLPQALHTRHDGDKESYNELIEALRKPVEDSLDASVKIDKEKVSEIIGPALGGMIVRYVSQLSQQIAQETDAKIRNFTSPSWWIGLIMGKERSQKGRLSEVIVLDSEKTDILAHTGGVGPSPTTITDLDYSASTLLDLSLSDEENAHREQNTYPELSPGVSGITIEGKHCSILAIAHNTAATSFGSLIQQVCDETDIILSPARVSDREFPATNEQRELIQEIVEKQANPAMEQPEAGTKKGSPLKWILSVGLLALLAAIGLFTWGNIRWGELLTSLEEEPGIRVLDHSNGIGGYRLHLLTDPLATPIFHVIRNHGYDPRNITIVSSHYLSQDETLAKIREANSTLLLKSQNTEQEQRIKAMVEEAAITTSSSFESEARNRELFLIRSWLNLPPPFSLRHEENIVRASGSVTDTQLTELESKLRHLDWIKTIDFSLLKVKRTTAPSPALSTKNPLFPNLSAQELPTPPQP